METCRRTRRLQAFRPNPVLRYSSTFGVSSDLFRPNEALHHGALWTQWAPLRKSLTTLSRLCLRNGSRRAAQLEESNFGMCPLLPSSHL